MKPMFQVRQLSSQRVLWSAIGLCLLLNFVFLGWQGRLSAVLEERKEEYSVDVDLSRNKTEHLEAYERVISKTKLPEAKSLSSNAWIQAMQAAVADQKLSLQELKPVRQQQKKGSKKSNLFLVVEGRMSDFVAFLYRIAEADDLVYLDDLNISRAAENADMVRAQMVLAQFEGR
jgi:Tfp pilus assembly protein PilO